mmetsp:Transcript_41238/g.110134  ORF Transcript_41238/g.110134 Transcript_41238/m.110134 type:complete len:170 (+) Transcript_41238:100-609(+)
MPGSGEVTVAVTHLDHIAEAQREVQLDHVVEQLSGKVGSLVLLGDANALTRSDYDDEQWKTLEDNNKKNKWLPPGHGCLSRLEALDLTDVFAVANSRADSPASTSPPSLASLPPSAKFTAHAHRPLFRIDYCFASSGYLREGVSARVHSDLLLSDHMPTSFDFTIPSKL